MSDLPSGISQRDVADLLGVSVSTVSRALSDNDRVSDITKRAVRDAYTTLAERAARSRTAGNPTAARPMIGVTLSHSTDDRSAQISDINFSEVLAGVGRACQRAGMIPYPWHVSRQLTGPEGEPFFAHVSGVITIGGIMDLEIIDAIARQDLPIVVAGGQQPGRGVSSVGSDNQSGIVLAVSHLLALGHRRIALVNGSDDTHTSHEKLAGYLLALTRAGIPFDPDLAPSGTGFSGFSEHAGDRAATDLLSRAQPPTAIVCAFDQIAAGVYRAAARLGFAVPGDLSVVGFHDDDIARNSAPPMTSIRVRRSEWGEVATETLLRLREPGAIRGTHTLLPVSLVVRESTAPPRPTGEP